MVRLDVWASSHFCERSGILVDRQKCRSRVRPGVDVAPRSSRMSYCRAQRIRGRAGRSRDTVHALRRSGDAEPLPTPRRW